MSEQPSPPSPSPSSTSSRRFGRIAGGCVLGCAGFIVVAVLLLVWSIRWATRATPLPEREVFLGPGVKALVAAELEPSDPGTIAFLGALAAADKGEEDAAFVRKALPVRCTGVVTDGAFLAFSLSRFANFIRLSLLPVRLADHGQGKAEHKGELILVDRKGRTQTSFALVGSTLLISSDLKTMKDAIDRLLAAPARDRAADRGGADRGGSDRGSDKGPESTDILPADVAAAPVFGVATDLAGALRIAGPLLGIDRASVPEDLLELVEGARLAGHLGEPDPGSLSGRLELRVKEVTPEHLEALSALGRSIAARLSEHRIESTAEVASTDGEIEVKFRLDGLAQALAGQDIKIGPGHQE